MVNKLKMIPLPIALFTGTLVIGFPLTSDSQQFIEMFNKNFTGSLGYFCLILLPSFLMAASLSRQKVPNLGFYTKLIAPLAGAGMICPDTAYAAMSPMAGTQKKSLVLGTFAGFKLLPPAGPLIIAASLGINDSALLLKGFILLIPVWIAGELFVKYINRNFTHPQKKASSENSLITLIPLLVMAVLILCGVIFRNAAVPALIHFLIQPAGALLIGAIWAWLMVPTDYKKDCFESAMKNTGRLVLLIGLSTAFGRTLAMAFPVSSLFNSVSSNYAILTLFLCAALFKTIQGSSMATFAAVAPVTAPIITQAAISPSLAVYSIALGSFVAVLPNDSFYWLTREDAYMEEKDGKATVILSAGSILQAVTGMVFLLLFHQFGIF